MKLLQLTVLACVLACGLAQDAYTQGLVQGGTLALGASALLALGVFAVNNNNNRNRGRFGGYVSPGYAPGYEPYGGYYPPPRRYNRFRRDAAAAADAAAEQDFEKILSRDKQKCGLRLVCELEARSAAGEDVGEYGQIIVDGLFGSSPAPVAGSDLTSARGQYHDAAYIGSQTDTKNCAELYSTCKYSSKVILSLVQIARQSRQ